MSDTVNTSITVSEEQKERIEQRVEEGGYTSQSDYIRSMLEAGESRVAALDPRTSETPTDVQTSHGTAEGAARSLSDAALIDQLPDGEGNKEGFDEIVEVLRKQFENVIATRLKELEQEESSPIKAAVRGNYWVEDQ
jgi:Arc/MetJ-type ribon-helix-helix transcriptional regulator